MSKRLALSLVASGVFALVACGGNPASTYCSNKATCDGTKADECVTAAGYASLTATCQRDADIYYDCLNSYATCSNKTFGASRCDSLQALIISCKEKAAADAGTASQTDAAK